MPHFGDISTVFAFTAISLLLALLTVRAALGGSNNSSLRQSLACSVPMLGAAVGAYLHDGISSAMAVLFTCATASALFASAASLLVAADSLGESAPTSPSAAMLLPLGIAILLIGTTARFTLASSVGLALLGLVSCDLLQGESSSANAGRLLHDILHFLLAMLPAALLAFVTRRLLISAADLQPFTQTGVTVLLLLAPALTVPIIIRAMHAAASPNPAAALRLCASLPLLALCYYLPALMGIDYAIHLRESDLATPAAIPPMQWRLDGAMLTLAGLLFAAFRFQLLRPSRWLGLVLMALYGAYVLLSLVHRLG